MTSGAVNPAAFDSPLNAPFNRKATDFIQGG